jgi:tetraacyldisaccharide 4'-kinase
MRLAARLLAGHCSQDRLHSLARMAAVPLSFVYAGIMATRSTWWERYARTPPLPTVSIGNLTVGGNGKTPSTLFLATRLRECGFRPAIVSRGYGGNLSHPAGLVSDGRHIMMTPREAGDEPVMLAKCFDGPVAVARRRIDGIKLLAANSLADVIVLDDGFQHVRLRRDFDLVLINQSLGLGNGRLLPAGPLRELPSAIRRADALVLVESPGAAHKLPHFPARQLMKGKPVLHARLEPSALTYSEKGEWHEAALLLDRRRVVAISGVANHAGFHATIRALGADLLRTLDYPDHHDYTPRDWDDIMAAARGAEMLLTTEKDLVKLERFAAPQVPLYAVRLKVTMEAQDEQKLLSSIVEHIGIRPAAELRTFTIQGGTKVGN